VALAAGTVAGWWLLGQVYDGVQRPVTPAWLVLVVFATQLLALGLNVWAVVRRSG
jgi:hypothetical protein